MQLLETLKKNHNVVIFIGGFLFDLVTIRRIDSWPDLALQLIYLTALTAILIYQYREHHGIWTASGRVASLWRYNVEFLHFFYGGLLSAYVVLYFKSSTGARPVLFFVLLVALMFINEMPQIRRYGYRLRLGLYAFCVCSFMTYFIPVLLGRMGSFLFLLSVALSGALVWRVTNWLAQNHKDFHQERVRLFMPAGGLLGLIVVLYFLRLIPPVPLSVQFQGIYHGVEKQNGQWMLTYEKPPFYLFWRKDSRPYRRREGDVVHYFARVFAPARFRHQVRIRWEIYNEARGKYETSDLVPLTVSGGRGEGFRGSVAKARFQPGRWRVTAETEDGRAIGLLKFQVVDDAETDSRRWRQSRM